MVSYNTYPILLAEAPPPENPQIPYHLNMVQAERSGLIAKEKIFKKKYKKYTKILNQLTWLNACAHSKFWGLSGSEDRGGGDNSIQFINFGRVGDKSFKE